MEDSMTADHPRLLDAFAGTAVDVVKWVSLDFGTKYGLAVGISSPDQPRRYAVRFDKANEMGKAINTLREWANG